MSQKTSWWSLQCKKFPNAFRIVFLENGPFLHDLWWFTYLVISQFSQTVSHNHRLIRLWSLLCIVCVRMGTFRMVTWRGCDPFIRDRLLQSYFGVAYKWHGPRSRKIHGFCLRMLGDGTKMRPTRPGKHTKNYGKIHHRNSGFSHEKWWIFP